MNKHCFSHEPKMMAEGHSILQIVSNVARPLLWVLIACSIAIGQTPPLASDECSRFYVDFSPSASMQFLSTSSSPVSGTAGTIEMWVKRDDWDARALDPVIFSNGVPHTDANSFYLSFHYGVGLHFRYGGTGQPGSNYAATTATDAFADGSWHHVAVTWQHADGNTYLKIILDGAVAASQSAALEAVASSILQFGYLGINYGAFSDGAFSDIRLWNYARSTEEISQGMSHLLTGSETQLLANWPLSAGWGPTSVNLVEGGPPLNHTNMGLNNWSVLDDGPGNCPPLLQLSHKSAYAGQQLSFYLQGVDFDLPAQSLSWSLDASSMAAGMTLNAESGEFGWSVDESHLGLHEVVVNLSDGELSAIGSFQIEVGTASSNRVPVLTFIPNKSVVPAYQLAFTARATDPDGDGLTFSLGSGPVYTDFFGTSHTAASLGMTINPSTGAFFWQSHQYNFPLSLAVEIIVSDGLLQHSQTFEITPSCGMPGMPDCTVPQCGVPGTANCEYVPPCGSSGAPPCDYPTCGVPGTPPCESTCGVPGTPDCEPTPTCGIPGTPSCEQTPRCGVPGKPDCFPVIELNLEPIENQTVTIDDVFSISIVEIYLLATEPIETPGDIVLVYTLDETSAGKGMSVASEGGLLSWQPGSSHLGEHQVTVTVTDNISALDRYNRNTNQSQQVTFSILVQPPCTPPAQPGEFIKSTLRVCQGASGIAYQIPGDLEATYQWNYTGADVTINGTGAEIALDFGESASTGILSVVATGCENSEARSIEIVVEAVPTSMMIIAVGPTATCQDSSVGLQLVTVPDGLTEVTWNTGENTNSIVATEAGEYYVTVTTNCTVIESNHIVVTHASVDFPEISANALMICDGQPVTLSGNTSGHLWAKDGTVIGGGEMIDVSAPGEYRLVSFGYCILYSDPIKLTENATPMAVNSFIQAPMLVNRGQNEVEYLIEETEGMIYNWTYSGEGVTLSNTNSGVLLNFSGAATGGVINVTAENGCGVSQPLSAAVAVNHFPTMEPVSNLTVDEGESVEFKVVAYDTDNLAQQLSYSLSSQALSLGMAIDQQGNFTWTPAESHDGSHSVSVFVSDGMALASRQFTIDVQEVNQAPVVSVISNKSVEEEAELIFSATASDADLPAQTLTFSLNDEAVAKGMSINNETGAFSWKPSEAQDGSYEITVTVSDGELTDSETITVTVNEMNSTPQLITIGNQVVNEGAELTFAVTASDADLPVQTLTFSIDEAAIATGMAINGETGAFSWMPTESQDGSHEVTVTVSDGELTDSETITITVIEVKSAPALAGIGNKNVEEGAELTFIVAASDADLPVQTLTFSIDEAAIATGMAINRETGAFSWMPTESQDGSHEVTVTVSGGELTDSETITITVIEVNSAPVLSAIGNKSVEEGAVLTFTATTTDADVPSQTLSYSLDDIAVANGMTVGASSGEFSWAPVAGQAGAYEVTLSVNDGVGSDSETFTVTATGATVEENHPPVVFEAVVDRSLTEGFASLEVNLAAVFTDEDDDNLAVSAESSDESVAMVSVSEQTLIISEAGIGQATVTVTADDGRGGSVSDSFDLEVVSASISGMQGEATLTMATYPNPTDGRLQVDLEGSFKGVLMAGIRNVSGLQFLETTVKGNSGKITTQLDLVGLAPGVYLLNISLDGKPVATRRIIKK